RSQRQGSEPHELRLALFGREPAATPVTPGARVELRVRPTGFREREQVDTRRDPRAAVDDDLLRIEELRRDVRGLCVRPVDGPGNTPGAGLDRLDLSAVPLGPPGVDDDEARPPQRGRELLSLELVAQPGARDEHGRVDLLLPAADRPEPRL